MRYRLPLAMVLVLMPVATFAQDDQERALTVAKEILDKGATLFDKRDAVAMAATYVETAEIILFKRSSDAGEFETEIKKGRVAIEEAYAGIFKDRKPEHKCRNTVELARFLGPDLLLIQGRFALDRDQGDIVNFVQIRAREGEQWKIVTLQLMELPKNP